MEMGKLILMNFLKDIKKCSVNIIENFDVFYYKRFNINYFTLILFKYVIIN